MDSFIHDRSALSGFSPKPLDLRAFLDELKTWVHVESPSFDARAVNRAMDLAATTLSQARASTRRIKGASGFGDCILARWEDMRKSAPGILILGHLDTVHPKGSLREMPWREEEGRCYGPGILDMKAGILIAIQAIRQVHEAGGHVPLPLTLLLTSDEEVGSPSTRELIEKEALRHKYVLIPEPARRDGGVVVGRHAVARFRLTVTGKASHSGLRLDEGISAIRELAHQIIAIEKMTTPTVKYSVGVIRGGAWVNCVPVNSEAEILVSAGSELELQSARAFLLDLPPVNHRVKVSVEETSVRPFWVPTAESLALYSHAVAIGNEMRLQLPSHVSYGGSDGNFTGALRIPTLDGLGACGDNPHTLNEYIDIGTLEQRVNLFSRLLCTIS